MFRSLKLGKVFGIDLYIHGTFWLLPLIILFSGLSAGDSVREVSTEIAFVFAVFACVALHEVGHAVTARAYKINTRHITLYPIGGVAALERIPDKPWQEIAIAVAGPAVNLIIAGVLFIGFLSVVALTPWAPDVGGTQWIDEFASRLLGANLILAVFNMLPCFPMDGGRVLRAALATQLNRVRATEIAVTVGSLVAFGFLVGGIWLSSFGLVLIAIVVWLLGQAELAGVRMRAIMKDHFSPEAIQAVLDEADPSTIEMSSESETIDSGYTGLMWDEKEGVWKQYEQGRVVRVIQPKA